MAQPLSGTLGRPRPRPAFVNFYGPTEARIRLRGGHRATSEINSYGGVQMKRFIVGTSLLVAIAFGGVATTSWALPEIGRCVSKRGHYSDANCSHKSPGVFAFVKNAAKPHFSVGGSPLGNDRWETSAHAVILTCGSTTSGGGEYFRSGASTKELRHVTFGWPACFEPGTNFTCHSPGQSPGVIRTEPLGGKLGYISGKGTTSPVVGALLFPEGTSVNMSWSCEDGSTETLVGCTSVSLEPVNIMGTVATWTLRFDGPESLEHSRQKCDSGGGRVLPKEERGGGLGAMTFPISNEEPLELKAF